MYDQLTLTATHCNSKAIIEKSESDVLEGSNEYQHNYLFIIFIRVYDLLYRLSHLSPRKEVDYE